MDLEKLIKNHHRLLEEKSSEDGFLKQRLKARLNEKKTSALNPLVFRFRKWLVVYGFVFLILIFFNFKLIDWLSTKKSPNTHVITMIENPFQPVFPGSISQAFQEVFKWPE